MKNALIGIAVGSVVALLIFLLLAYVSTIFVIGISIALVAFICGAPVTVKLSDGNGNTEIRKYRWGKRIQ